jgi:tetratricopeptide (TPR) repeat protein
MVTCRAARVASVIVAVVQLTRACPATAQQRHGAKPETQRVQAVGAWAFKRLDAAHQALAKSQYDEALRSLEEMKGHSRLNEHETALMWQTFGYVYAGQEKYKQATEAFEKCIAAGGLPDSAQLDTAYNLGQLYLAQERFADAVRVFAEWFAKNENPGAEAHYVYAIALYKNGDSRAALRQGERALEKSPKPRESWLQLVLSLCIEEKDFQKAVGVSETLVALFAKKTSWSQLLAIYSHLEDYKRALAVMALMHAQGMLGEERELTQLAQLYLFNDLPFEAGRVLDEALAAGKIEGTAQTWRLLSDAWVNAREREEAQQPLAKAAELSEDGELYVRLAQIQLEREAWGAARESLRRALQTGKLADPGNAQLLLGIASANDKDWERARAAFAAAAKYEKLRRSAEQWLVEVDAEVERSAADPAPGTKRATSKSAETAARSKAGGGA